MMSMTAFVIVRRRYFNVKTEKHDYCCCFIGWQTTCRLAWQFSLLHFSANFV